jgi:LEA14-like dessication related protein
MNKFIILLLVTVGLFSCDMENRKPEYKRFENVQVKNFTVNNITITADAIIFNPNGVSIFLNKTEIDVFANDIKVSHISQTEHTEITKKSEFKIPLKAKFKPQDLVKDEGSILDILSSGLKSFTDKNMDLKFVGTATFQVAGIPFDVPIEYEEKVDLR